jgi:imidazole glycerol-phosphate synthase subunit HisH
MIVIVDYSMGNVKSIQNQINRMGFDSVISSSSEILEDATKIILPGVGNFVQGMKNLQNSGLSDILSDLILNRKKLILGICLGMQLMTNHSEEGSIKGLGWVDAETIKFNLATTSKYKTPHMGWNTLVKKRASPILNNITEEDFFYFVHSYHVICNESPDIVATTRYGIEFVSVFQKSNIYGVQFHPEKSHSAGLQMLRNFILL